MKRAVQSPVIRSKAGKSMNNSGGNDSKRPVSSPAGDAKARAQLSDQAPGNVDKIRDILFGTQMRDYEVRFARLEESLRKESSDLRDSTRKRLDSLEAYVKKEFESLDARVRAEKKERGDSHSDLASELKAAASALTKKIGEVESENSQGQRDLRKELLAQSNKLNDEIRSQTEELSSLFEKRLEELRNTKADRAALASLLTEVALRLTDEFQVPGTE